MCPSAEDSAHGRRDARAGLAGNPAPGRAQGAPALQARPRRATEPGRHRPAGVRRDLFRAREASKHLVGEVEGGHEVVLVNPPMVRAHHRPFPDAVRSAPAARRSDRPVRRAEARQAPDLAAGTPTA